MSVYITREYLISLLEAWKSGKLDAKQVYETANDLLDNNDLEYLDWEGNEDNSVTLEVLRYLENIDMNLVIKEDIEPCVEFLRFNYGKFNEAYKKWESYRNSIDFYKRKVLLKDVDLYRFYLNF